MVIAFADRLRSEGWLVLAEGGNQGAAFRYAVEGIMKAPDVVALREVELLVAEGKLRARDLVIAGKRGVSDLAACQALAQSSETKLILAHEAARRCRASGISCASADAILVRPVLFSHDAAESVVAQADAAAIPLFVIA